MPAPWRWSSVADGRTLCGSASGARCSPFSKLNPVSALDVITHEIHAARRAHQHKTKERDYRAGSKARAYCDDLRTLVTTVLMNGDVPHLGVEASSGAW